MEHCPKCKSKISIKDVFCKECGTKVPKQDVSGKIKAPRWYYITSIIMIVVLVLEIFWIASFTSTLASVILFAITGIGWAVFNFVIAIYFLAKKYEKVSLIFPVAFIIQSLITVPLVNNVSETFGFIEVGIFSLFIIGYSLYNLWKK
tara:strand:+ start:118 stop:558 length:441 start_codon:yes stop_codon:yes gene_type:complete